MTTRHDTDSPVDRPNDHVVLFDMDGVILEGWGTDDAAFLRREHNAGLDPDPEPTFEIEGLRELTGIADGGAATGEPTG